MQLLCGRGVPSAGPGRARRWLGAVAVGAAVAAGCVGDLGTLGGRWATATDVNEAGVVVGESTVAGSEVRHAFRRLPGHRMEDLNGSFLSSAASAVNDAGLVVGWAEVAAGDVRATAWDRAGRPHDLGLGRSSSAADINVHGVVAGWRPGPGGGYEAVVRRPGGTVDVLPDLPHEPGEEASSEPRAINDDGLVVGQAYLSPHFRAVAWPVGADEPVVLSEPDADAYGRTVASAEDVDDDGTVVGWSTSRPSALAWRAGTYELVQLTPPPSGGSAEGINDRGQVVGRDGETGRATRWDLRTGDRTDLGGLGGAESAALAVNDRGLAVGWAATGEPPPPGGLPPRHAVLYRTGPPVPVP